MNNYEYHLAMALKHLEKAVGAEKAHEIIASLPPVDRHASRTCTPATALRRLWRGRPAGLSRTKSTETAIYNRMLRRDNVTTLSEIKSWFAGMDWMPLTAAIWNLKRRGKIVALGGGRYKLREH